MDKKIKFKYIHIAEGESVCKSVKMVGGNARGEIALVVGTDGYQVRRALKFHWNKDASSFESNWTRDTNLISEKYDEYTAHIVNMCS